LTGLGGEYSFAQVFSRNMLLRLLLVGTILIGIGAIAVSQFVVRPHVKAVTDARNKALSDYQREKSDHEKVNNTLKETLSNLAASETNFDEAKKQLTAVNTKAIEQEKRANSLDQKLAETKNTLAGVQADLAAWNALGVPVDRVNNLVAEAKKLRAANEAMEKKAQILTVALKKVYDTINAEDFDTAAEPPLPSGLKGTTLAVDPKYDFVVLDIGAAKGLQPRGVLLVRRDSKLIAKVKVARVQEERSIANIEAGWKLGQVMEGDQVIVR